MAGGDACKGEAAHGSRPDDGWPFVLETFKRWAPERAAVPRLIARVSPGYDWGRRGERSDATGDDRRQKPQNQRRRTRMR
jgi:hypothetical protein